jgi:hypothetical protein
MMSRIELKNSAVRQAPRQQFAARFSRVRPAHGCFKIFASNGSAVSPFHSWPPSK